MVVAHAALVMAYKAADVGLAVLPGGISLRLDLRPGLPYTKDQQRFTRLRARA
jgi:hypothetical protein